MKVSRRVLKGSREPLEIFCGGSVLEASRGVRWESWGVMRISSATRLLVRQDADSWGVTGFLSAKRLFGCDKTQFFI